MICPLLLLYAGTITANEVTVCDEKWEDANNVGLGCLWIEKLEKFSYVNAIKFCKNKNSRLIEIDSSKQMEFILDKLKPISDSVEWDKITNNVQVKSWYGGATETEEKNGIWTWTQSGKPLVLDSYVWGKDPKQPNNLWSDQKYYCFTISTGSNGNFYGNDCSNRGYYPLCQQM